MSKIIPSPDWFVGVSSFSLKEGGDWLTEAEVPLNIFDAGTDQGFTFSSPNWESRPQEFVTRITSQHPSHPANSFHYPDREHLPTIASLTLTKLMTSSECSDVITDDVYVDVEEGNLVAIEPSTDEIFKANGDGVVLTCSVNIGFPSDVDANLRWFKAGEEITQTAGRLVRAKRF